MLDARRYLIKEKTNFIRVKRIYDIFDGDTQEEIAQAKELVPSWLYITSFFLNRQLFPATVEVREVEDDSLVFSIYRGFALFRSVVEVRDAQGDAIGYFKAKLFSFSGGFTILDRNKKPFAQMKGNFIGFEYRVLTPEGDFELGKVTKKWGGIAKELFTSADTYKVDVSDELDDNPMAKILVIAAALATDILYKSR